MSLTAPFLIYKITELVDMVTIIPVGVESDTWDKATLWFGRMMGCPMVPFFDSLILVVGVSPNSFPKVKNRKTGQAES